MDVPLTAVKIGKFRPLPEPIRLQDLVHLARSRAEKKIKRVTLYFYVCSETNPQILVLLLCILLKMKNDLVTVGTTGLISPACFREAFHEPFWHPGNCFVLVDNSF